MNNIFEVFETIEATYDLTSIMMLVCLYIAVVVTYIACKK